MDNRTTNLLLRYLHKAAAPAEVGRLTDRQLLERFVQRRDEAAFEVLVHRHGPMVWRVCRQLLPNTQDCEDACQATFLVLVRKAGSVGRPELLGNWLYGVALRVAGRIRKTVGRRQAHERPGTETLAGQTDGAAGGPDRMGDLHEELYRLPAKYRRPLVLCYLEGRTNEEAARQLRCPLGTLKVRLLRGRAMLRTRLVRRGLAFSPGMLVSALSNGANETLPVSLGETTVRAGLLFATGRAVATGAPCPRAVALTQGVLHAMWWTQGKALAAVLLTVGLFGTGAGWLVFRSTALPAAPSNRAVPGGHAEAARPEPMPPEPAPAPERPGGAPQLPPPGGDAPVTRARLTRACLLGIRDETAWYFRGQKFILAADKDELPTGLVRALLGPGGKAARIRGEWDLDTEKGQLVLTALVVDGKPGPKEVRLGISPAGLMRVNVEHAGQYNVLSFEDKLHVPGPGEIFPIYDVANRIDLKFLQGAWDLRGLEADGKTLPASALQGSRVVVQGNAITLVFQGATSRGTFQLDSVPTPRTLDVTFTEGPEKGNRYLGIYELQEDTWRFCRTPAGKGRPTAFAGKAGSGHLLEKLQRAAEDSTGLPPRP
jgi:RNA polymerase sigma factor (sigma-70 family)